MPAYQRRNYVVLNILEIDHQKKYHLKKILQFFRPKLCSHYDKTYPQLNTGVLRQYFVVVENINIP